MMKHRFAAIAALAALIPLAPASDAGAQSTLRLGGGLGAVWNEHRELPESFDSFSHKLAFASLRIPLIPLELRGEALWPEDPFKDGPRAYIVSGVIALPIPVVTPYAQGGWGDYNFGDPERAKWSAGLGLRVDLGGVGIFAEATRYNRMNADLLTGGLMLRFGGH